MALVVSTLLSAAEHAGIVLRVDGEELVVRAAPAHRALVEAIGSRKAEVLAHLRARPTALPKTDRPQPPADDSVRFDPAGVTPQPQMDAHAPLIEPGDPRSGEWARPAGATPKPDDERDRVNGAKLSTVMPTSQAPGPMPDRVQQADAAVPADINDSASTCSDLAQLPPALRCLHVRLASAHTQPVDPALWHSYFSQWSVAAIGQRYLHGYLAATTPGGRAGFDHAAAFVLNVLNGRRPP